MEGGGPKKEYKKAFCYLLTFCNITFFCPPPPVQSRDSRVQLFETGARPMEIFLNLLHVLQ